MSWCKSLLSLLLAVLAALGCACSSDRAGSPSGSVRPASSPAGDETKAAVRPRSIEPVHEPVPEPRTDPRALEDIYRNEVNRRKAEREWRDMVRRESEKQPK